MTIDDQTRRVIALIVAAALLLVLASAALAAVDPKLPHGKTCDDVRENVERYGKATALAWAVREGYSPLEIWEASKCLEKRRRRRG